MVKGLELFRSHFAPYKDQYVVIGGTACTVLMLEAGLDFRATKDIDLVLYVEALEDNFVSAFWEFVEKGGYQNRQRSNGKEIFYRFDSPKSDDYPYMIELFSRMPKSIKFDGKGHLTPIPTTSSIPSLSAILLDEDYYLFTQAGKHQIKGLSLLTAYHLIPLKARAFLDLKDRKKSGENVDDKDIRKHKNDIIRLFQLLSPSTRVDLPGKIKKDFKTFLEDLSNDKTTDCKNFGLRNTNIQDIVETLGVIFGVQ